MKTFAKIMFLAFLVAYFTACAKNESGSPTIKSDSGPAPVTPDPVPSPIVSNPGANSPPAMVPTPTPTPAPVTNLSCYNNNGFVFCTGGNLGSSLIEIDTFLMFTGNNATNRLTVTKVTNENNSTYTSLCSQPNQAGCHQHSVCIYATVTVPGYTQQAEMLCGNTVDLSTNTLKEL